LKDIFHSDIAVVVATDQEDNAINVLTVVSVFLTGAKETVSQVITEDLTSEVTV
jgi:hypothetical protein